ncbi:Nucleoside-diphosphate-sugar epimerase [Thiothrix eikelboomii]|uniref:Nucleoside-diphosphate-sugar epimerase n=1 Tax=Thiothrix eikelboomii TaxID=92487 RepID=A0A1T4WCM0_9GAMM|nr:SDR family oxidoreductase [Thiothrix eikelboomii]SKA75033.1 Nucleoside-diphosphate-sugar epimerase [Thiothrix eikelboomii]
MSRLWIMGCGDIGRRVARLYQNQGVEATGWVRSAASLSVGVKQGLAMRLGDMDQGCFFPRNAFEEAEIFWLLPPPPSGGIDSRLRRFLLAVQGAPKRIVLISTTGVYGDCAGRWIDESEPLKPQVERAKRRADAELALQAWGNQYNGDWVILRVPGIYAAERLPLERLQRGEPVLLEAEAPWTNRIHADDLAQICVRAMQVAPKHSIYNACDGEPLSMTAYFNQVAQATGLAPPPQLSLAEASSVVSAGMLSYLQESRRIKNHKLLNELGLQLLYPNLAAGLKAVMRNN